MFVFSLNSNQDLDDDEFFGESEVGVPVVPETKPVRLEQKGQPLRTESKNVEIDDDDEFIKGDPAPKAKKAKGNKPKATKQEKLVVVRVLPLPSPPLSLTHNNRNHHSWIQYHIFPLLEPILWNVLQELSLFFILLHFGLVAPRMKES
jgi:hypothetical protein